MVQTPQADVPSGWKGVKRFYDTVGVRAVDKDGNETSVAAADGFKVLIQGREMRTNGMNDLVVCIHMRAPVPRSPRFAVVRSRHLRDCACSCRRTAWLSPLLPSSHRSAK
jgi:hypothetical protein